MININQIIDVRMAEMIIARGPLTFRTVGVGSCLVIIVYDSVNKIGGFAHAMLPSKDMEIPGDMRTFQGEEGEDFLIASAKYVDDVIDQMVQRILAIGGERDCLRAKIIGGAQMFRTLAHQTLAVGAKNINTAKKKLKMLHIPLQSEDTGGNIGRSVEFSLQEGTASIAKKINFTSFNYVI